jgi:UDP-glucose 4-epimerase
MKKILITGAAGFLGSHLAEYFVNNGDFVVGIDDMSGGSWNNVKAWQRDTKQTYFIQLNCCDYKHMREICDEYQFDIVYHCACLPHEGLSVFSPHLITKSVYNASVAVFSAAIASGVKRIIYMSSMARYGHGQPNRGFKESFAEYEPTLPIDPYGIAKVAAEETLKCLCDTHGVEYVIAVPHNIIGTRQNYTDPHRNVASIMMNLLKQNKDIIIYGDGTQTRCFSPVKDCLHSLIQLTDLSRKDFLGHIVNIGPDKGAISINELAQKISKLGEVIFNPTYFPDRPREVKHALCSSDKARKLLGYVEQQSLDDCLQEMWNDIPEGGSPFIYDNKPLEIINEKTPKTWSQKLI